MLGQYEKQLNKACREITRYLKAFKVNDLYLLAGTAPPEIQRKACASVENINRMKLTHYLDRNQQRSDCSPETVF